MPAVAESFSLGTPVEIGSLQKELKKLWAESAGAMTRTDRIVAIVRPVTAVTLASSP